MTRRLSSRNFFKNRPFTVSKAGYLLRTIQQEPGAGNRRLSALTGLGITSDDENDGVLPTYISYLLAMDLIAPASREDIRFLLTDLGKAILDLDPMLAGRGTLSLLAMLLCEPRTGAHLYDWAVQGRLEKLAPFKLDDLHTSVEQLSTEENLGANAGANLELLMKTFTEREAFGLVSPWTQKNSGHYVPRLLIDIEPPIFWAIAYELVRLWPVVFPGTFECSLRDMRRNLLYLPRGVLGIKGRTEELLLTQLQRENIITRSAVTTERVALVSRSHDLPAFLRRAIES